MSINYCTVCLQTSKTHVLFTSVQTGVGGGGKNLQSTDYIQTSLKKEVLTVELQSFLTFLECIQDQIKSLKDVFLCFHGKQSILSDMSAKYFLNYSCDFDLLNFVL